MPGHPPPGKWGVGVDGGWGGPEAAAAGAGAEGLDPGRELGGLPGGPPWSIHASSLGSGAGSSSGFSHTFESPPRCLKESHLVFKIVLQSGFSPRCPKS